MIIAEKNEATLKIGKSLLPFVFDTSALVSLESVDLLGAALIHFKIITSPRTFDEISDFAVYDDELGKAAQRVLEKKKHISLETPETKEELAYVSQTDNEVFNLALSKKITLITDDIKLTRHAKNKIQTEFSTHFLPAFIEVGLLTTSEALQKLEKMRTARNWQDNVIYVSAKEELNSKRE